MLNNPAEIQDRISLKKAVRQHDQQSQQYVYSKFKPFLCQFIKSIGDFDEQAEALVQDVFVIICAGKCKYSASTDVKSYLCGIAKNVVRKYIRGKKPKNNNYSTSYKNIKLLQSNIKTPEEYVQLKEAEQASFNAILKLPEKTRRAVELTIIQEMPYESAAIKVGCSVFAFRSRLQHGLEKLREELQDFVDYPKI